MTQLFLLLRTGHENSIRGQSSEYVCITVRGRERMNGSLFDVIIGSSKVYLLRIYSNSTFWLTTYEVIMKDWSSLGEIAWTGVVMDEAHRMRNINCKFIQFINNIHTKHKLLLTGTPLQNNTGELWPLLNFIDVSEAGSLERFKEEFGDLRSSEQVERLRTLLSKCMLRRVKEEVEKSIPRKQETYC